MKVVVILNIPPPTSVKQMWMTLGYMGYYRQFIQGYVRINTPLEYLINKYEEFHWTKNYDKSFDLLKEKLRTTPILTYPNSHIEFHVHIDASVVSLGVILAQHGEGTLAHPVYFTSHKLSQVELKYTATKREWLAMVYALQKFRHYLLGIHFNFFTDHYNLKYLVNKPML